MTDLALLDCGDLVDPNDLGVRHEALFENYDSNQSFVLDDEYLMFLNDMNDSDFALQGPDLELPQDAFPPREVSADVIQGQFPGDASPPQAQDSESQPLLAFHDDMSPVGQGCDVQQISKLLRIEAQLGGRIKLPDSTASDQNELTFYRRNLFKVSGRVYFRNESSVVLANQGVLSLAARLDAVESIEGESAKLIKIPVKPEMSGDETTAKEESVLPILLGPQAADLAGNSFLEVSWDRLQFRRATTKTRGSAAQRYQLRITVVATLSDNSELIIARAASEFIVVRGRSPKNYPDQAKGRYYSVTINKKSGEPASRRQSIFATTLTEYHEDVQESEMEHQAKHGSWSAPARRRRQPENAQSRRVKQPSGRTNSESQATDLDLYSDGSDEFSATEATLTGPCHGEGPILGFQAAAAPSQYAALKSRRISDPAELAKESAGLLLPTLRGSAAHITGEPLDVRSIDEESHSYEYIPLSINDWSAPVDPVYRPHGVHHKTVKDPYGRSAAKKRYFIDVK